MANVIQRFIEIFVKGDAASDLQKTENALKGVDTQTQKVTHSTEKLTDSTKKHSQSVVQNGGAIGLLNELTGGLASTFKDATEAIELTGTSMKGLKGAILATGIGALVIIIGELVTNWDKWKGAIDGSTKALEDNEKALSNLNVQIDRYTQKSNFQIELLEAQGASEEDIYNARIRQLAELAKLKEEEKQKLEEAYRIQLARDATSKETEEARLARNAKSLEITGLIQKATVLNAQFLKSQRDQEIADKKKADEEAKKAAEAAEKERLAALKAEHDRIIEEERSFRETIKALRVESNDEMRQINTDNQIVEAEDNNGFQATTLDSLEAYYEQQKELEKNLAIAKDDIRNASFDAAKTGIKILASFAEKNKGVQKAALIAENAIGIAQIVINTMKANAAVVAKYAGIPGAGPALAAAEIALNNINAGVGIATSVAATIKGLQALGGGNPGGGESALPGATGGVAQPPAAQFNIVGQNPQNQLLSGQQGVIKAQVVSSEVSSAQALDRNRVEQAVFL